MFIFYLKETSITNSISFDYSIPKETFLSYLKKLKSKQKWYNFTIDEPIVKYSYGNGVIEKNEKTGETSYMNTCILSCEYVENGILTKVEEKLIEDTDEQCKLKEHFLSRQIYKEPIQVYRSTFTTLNEEDPIQYILEHDEHFTINTIKIISNKLIDRLSFISI